MSNMQQSHKAGQAHGQAQAKTEEWIQSAQNTANKAQDNTGCGGGAGQQQMSRDQNAGFLHQTGEQMVNMAQGAIDGVKNTLGVGAQQSPGKTQNPNPTHRN